MYEFHNQYPSLLGLPELRQAVAQHSHAYQGLALDWQTETLVTVGATEGIASAIMGLCNEGDEVCVCGGGLLADHGHCMGGRLRFSQVGGGGEGGEGSCYGTCVWTGEGRVGEGGEGAG